MLALKNRVVLKIFTVLNILFTFRIVWATCACPEKQVCPGIFQCIEIYFIIQDFWATCACPEMQCLAWNFSLYCMCNFYQSGFFSNLRLPWKTEFGLEFFTVLNMYFLSCRIFERLALVLKTEFALKFLKPGVDAPPDPPPCTTMGASVTGERLFLSCITCCLIIEAEGEIHYHLQINTDFFCYDIHGKIKSSKVLLKKALSTESMIGRMCKFTNARTLFCFLVKCFIWFLLVS